MTSQVTKFKNLVRKEMLEHKNTMIITPIVIGAAMLFFFLLALTVADSPVNIIIEGADNLSAEETQTLTGQLSTLQAEVDAGDTERQDKIHKISKVAMLTYTQILWVVNTIVVFFILLGTLYEERRDRSILFWKSMPVSDTQEVLAKLVAAVFGTTACYLVMTFIVQAGMVLAGGLYLTSSGLSFDLLASPLDLPFMWVKYSLYVLIVIFWAAPVIAWLMLVSAYASRLPMLVAIVPVVSVSLMEYMLFKTSYVGEWLYLHLIAGPLQAANAISGHAIGNGFDLKVVDYIFSGEFLFNSYLGSLMSPYFWSGLALTAIMLTGAVQLRKRAL